MRFFLCSIFISISINAYAFKDKEQDNNIRNYFWNGSNAVIDFDIHTYINTITQILEDEYELFVIDDGEINAFATEYTMIGINKGLITKTKNEEELLSVIAHEIGHISLKHFDRMRANNNGSLLTIGSLVLAGITNDSEVTEALVSTAIASSIQTSINWTRRFEIEADNFAKEELSLHDMNSNAMSDFFLRLRQHKETIEYLQTHPLSINRAINSYNNENIAPKLNSEYYEVLKGLLGSDDISVYAEQYLQAYELFKEQQYPEALNILESSNMKGVLSNILKARTLSKLSRSEEAIALLQDNSVLSKYYLAQVYIEQNQLKIAASILKNHNYHKPNYYFYVLLESIYTKTKELDKYHSTFADRLLFTGDVKNARINYNLAQSLTQNTDLRQKIDAKLNTLN